MEVRNGFELSNMEAVGLSIGQSEKNNRDNVKSKFIVLTLQMYVMVGTKKIRYVGKTRHVLFEDELPGLAIEVLSKYIATTQEGQQIKDSKGGLVVDLQALRACQKDYELCESFLDWPGGTLETYQFKKGECWANDSNGKYTQDASGNYVHKSSMEILTQVVQYIDGKPRYAPGMSLEARGQRLENRFWRTPVTGTTPIVTQQPQQPAQQPPTQPQQQQVQTTPEPPQQPQQPIDPNQPPF